MIDYRRDTAIHEAIIKHAERFHDGKLDLEATLTALAEVTASYLAEIPGREKRQAVFDQHMCRIAGIANHKTRNEKDRTICRS